MRPAPIDEAGNTVCDVTCGACMPWSRNWHWKMVTLGSCVVKHCPACGRALGFDAEGNPVVGESPAHLERALDYIAGQLKIQTDCNSIGPGHSPSIHQFVQQSLDATRETDDDLA